jgi:hypothetical protein
MRGELEPWMSELDRTSLAMGCDVPSDTASAIHWAPMVDHRTRTIATMRESIRSLQQVLETERRIASGSSAELAERARTEIPKIEARIAEAEARVRELEALPPA